MPSTDDHIARLSTGETDTGGPPVGSWGRSRRRWLLLGNVSGRLVVEADGSVLLVPPARQR